MHVDKAEQASKDRINGYQYQIDSLKSEAHKLRGIMLLHLDELEESLAFYRKLLKTCKDQEMLLEIDAHMDIMKSEIQQVKLLLNIAETMVS